MGWSDGKRAVSESSFLPMVSISKYAVCALLRDIGMPNMVTFPAVAKKAAQYHSAVSTLVWSVGVRLSVIVPCVYSDTRLPLPLLQHTDRIPDDWLLYINK